IPRRIHDLARVAVGAGFVLGLSAALVAGDAIVAVLDGTSERFAALDPVSWANLFGAPLIAYLLVSPFALWSDYSITRWVMGILLGGGLVVGILSSRGIDILSLPPSNLGLVDVLTGGIQPSASGEAWWPAAALWFGVGLALTLFTGMYRPADLR